MKTARTCHGAAWSTSSDTCRQPCEPDDSACKADGTPTFNAVSCLSWTLWTRKKKVKSCTPVSRHCMSLSCCVDHWHVAKKNTSPFLFDFKVCFRNTSPTFMFSRQRREKMFVLLTFETCCTTDDHRIHGSNPHLTR